MSQPPKNPARKHLEEDMVSLFRTTGCGNYALGIRRIANWCGITEKHVRFWFDYQQRIPDRRFDEVQKCCHYFSGKRVEIRIANEDVAMRKCLRCAGSFESTHIGNRICNQCKGQRNFKKELGGLDEYRTLAK